MDWIFDFVGFVDSFGYCFDSRIERERGRNILHLGRYISRLLAIISIDWESECERTDKRMRLHNRK